MIESHLSKVLSEVESAALQAKRKREEITLIAVSKGEPLEVILEAYRLGLRDFGENRVNELLEKKAHLPSDIRWHFIGKLQRNKVAKIIGHTSLIHSVDTLELAEKISAESVKRGVHTDILLEVNTSGEKSKSGMSRENLRKVFAEIMGLKNISVLGLMTMAPFTEDEGVIRHAFSDLRHLSDELQLEILSMGMSHDFPIAIQEGSNMLRIGTAIFKSVA